MSTLDSAIADFQRDHSNRFTFAEPLVDTSTFKLLSLGEDGTPGNHFFGAATIGQNSVLFNVAPTGEPTDVWSVVEGARTRLLDLDYGYHFHLHPETNSILSLDGDGPSSPDNTLGNVVALLSAQIHLRQIEGSEFPGLLSYSTMEQRHRIVQSQDGQHDIIPNRNLDTVILKISDGCRRVCDYCFYWDIRLDVSRRSIFEQRVSDVADGYDSIGLTGKIKTVFFNGADAGYLDRYHMVGKTPTLLKKGEQPEDHLSLIEAMRLAKQRFPEVEHFEAFIGGDTTLELSKDNNATEGYREITRGSHVSKYTIDYFQNLKQEAEDLGMDITLWTGIESAHDVASAVQHKNITYQEKLLAAHLIMAAGIGYRPIFQAGLNGKLFRSRPKKDREFTWQDGVQANINFVHALPHNVFGRTDIIPEVYLSTFTNSQGLAYQALVDQHFIDEYDSFEDGVRAEKALFGEGIRGPIEDGTVRFTDDYQKILSHSRATYHTGDDRQFVNEMTLH